MSARRPLDVAMRAAGESAALVRLVARRPRRDTPRVYYGRGRLARSGDEAAGGMVRLQRLQRAFPNDPHRFNVVYLGSNTLPLRLGPLLSLTRRKRVPIVWNQDGVAYPAWHGPGWERTNAPMARGLRAAAHVFYQSAFCKLAADRYLGESSGRWEILHNAVDTTEFTPGDRPAAGRPPTLLLGGNQYERYRLEAALRTLTLLPREVALIVTGALTWSPAAPAETRALVSQLGLAGRVHFAGPYAQRDAPALLRGADVLLHTKVNDPCPSIVIEAMACGLPVVHTSTGGVPELVGDDAGVGVETPLDWDRQVVPDPEGLAAAVLRVLAARDRFAAAARRRAVERFDVEPWLERHRAVFAEVLA